MSWICLLHNLHSLSKNSKASINTCWAWGWQRHAQLAEVSKGISPTPLKLHWLPLESSGSVAERAISLASNGTHERNCPWTLEQPSYLLMFYLLSCYFTLKAKGPNMSQPNDLLQYVNSSFPLASQNSLSPWHRLHRCCIFRGTTMGQTHNCRESNRSVVVFSSSSICPCICMRKIHKGAVLHSIMYFADNYIQISNEGRWYG